MYAKVNSLIVALLACRFIGAMKNRNRTILTLTVPPAWRDEIDRRASALNLTRATYANLILAKWWDDGKPPVTQPDRLMQLAIRSTQDLTSGAAKKAPTTPRVR
jgi:hypothetical protein